MVQACLSLLRFRFVPPIGAAVVLVASLGLPVGGPLLPAQAASALLESVKQNPGLAKSLCAEFKQLNARGQSATSPQAIATLARNQGLSPVDAEVLTTYVIGLHCPDVN
ncbi:MAG: hypothetical protein NT158_11535 [Cyanobacteria bacterium]|nr:hypothetical protein [Cyanobacteriota bacterium]